MIKHSAGLLVYRINDGQLEVLIGHMGGPFFAKKDKAAWSIPKGEYDETEDPKTAARHEFQQEIGQPPPDGDWLELGQVEYKNKKRVSIWAIEGEVDANNIQSNTFELEWPPRSGQTQQFPEIDRAEWLTIDQPRPKLIPAQCVFLDRLSQQLGVEPLRAARQEALF